MISKTDSSSPERTLSRRSVLEAGIALGVGAAARAATTQPVANEPIEVRPLGRTGLKVTRLAAGGSFPEYGRRILEFTYRSGVRYFDNGDLYCGFKAETLFGDWIRQRGCRADIIITTKARTTDPAAFEARVDDALKKMRVDTIDLFFLHGLEDPAVPLDADGQWRTMKDRLVREKKVRFMGFSTHAEMPRRIACLTNAARSGWVDALMMACDPVLIRSDAGLNRAIDTCAKAGVGLLAMKTGRGLGAAGTLSPRAIEAFRALGMSPHTAMLAGIWSDERFAAACSEMPSFKIVEENAAAARAFRKPFTPDEWKLFDEAAKGLARTTCPGCDGSCRRAAGTQTDFCSIMRYLAYCEESGNLAAARELYAELAPEQRDWRDADLAAASQACRSRLDFERLLARAARWLG
ncbi:MAG: aldo/keto reductase [Phycisphaerae bacterium]|nr:aldo/keto reductase [Phycisphaerae bacterium]